MFDLYSVFMNSCYLTFCQIKQHKDRSKGVAEDLNFNINKSMLDIETTTSSEQSDRQADFVRWANILK